MCPSAKIPDFFDNFLDDAAPIGELPDLDQVPEFVDEEQKSSSDEQQLPVSLGTERANQVGDIKAQFDRPIFVNPSDGGILDRLSDEDLPDGFSLFNFDSPIKERDEDPIPFGKDLNGSGVIANTEVKLLPGREEDKENVENEAEIHANDHVKIRKRPHAVAGLSCEEDVPLAKECVKRPKPEENKLNFAANEPQHSHDANGKTEPFDTNVHIPEAIPSGVSPPDPLSSEANVCSPDYQRGSLSRASRGSGSPNHTSDIGVFGLPARPKDKKTDGPVTAAATSMNNPPGLQLTHVAPSQQGSTMPTNDLVSPATPLGMLPDEVRDQLLNQARRQSYAAAEMRALMIAQEYATTMYKKSHNGGKNLNNSSYNAANSPAALQELPLGSMPPSLQLADSRSGAAHRVTTPNAMKRSGVQSQHHAASQKQGTSDQVVASTTMQVHPGSRALRRQDFVFSRISSTESQSKQTLLQQHPFDLGLPRQVNDPSYAKLPFNADRSMRSVNSTGLTSSLPTPAPYPIIDMRLAALSTPPPVGPSGMPVPSAETRQGEALAHTLANTNDQVNKISTTVSAGGKVRKPQPKRRRHGGFCSSERAPNLDGQENYPPQSQAQDVAQRTAPTTNDAKRAAALRRQMSENSNGPRLRFSKNAGPSKYCHICGRSSSTVSVAVCGNLPVGLCRKVLCEKCLLIHEPELLKLAKQTDSGWICTHCRNKCPSKARCHQYTRNNQKRREKNDEKKKLKRQLQVEQQQQQEYEIKSTALSCDDDVSNVQSHSISPTGISDSVFD